jgi:hypothetical protein
VTRLVEFSSTWRSKMRAVFKTNVWSTFSNGKGGILILIKNGLGHVLGDSSGHPVSNFVSRLSYKLKNKVEHGNDAFFVNCLRLRCDAPRAVFVTLHLNFWILPKTHYLRLKSL